MLRFYRLCLSPCPCLPDCTHTCARALCRCVVCLCGRWRVVCSGCERHAFIASVSVSVSLSLSLCLPALSPRLNTHVRTRAVSLRGVLVWLAMGGVLWE